MAMRFFLTKVFGSSLCKLVALTLLNFNIRRPILAINVNERDMVFLFNTGA